MRPLRFEWEVAVRDSDLRPTAKLCALVLATYMTKDGGGCMPSRQTIADGMGIGLRATRRTLDELREAGWIERHRGKGMRSKHGGYLSNLYVPTIPEGGSTTPIEDEGRGSTTPNDGGSETPVKPSAGINRGSSDIKGGSETPIPSHESTMPTSTGEGVRCAGENENRGCEGAGVLPDPGSADWWCDWCAPSGVRMAARMAAS
jgi:hypothetical protein